MAGPIFLGKSLEDLDSEYGQDLKEPTIYDDASEVLDSLEAYRGLLNASLEEGGFSRDGIKAIMIHLNAIAKHHPVEQYSLESFDLSSNKAATLDAIAKITAMMDVLSK